LVNSLRETQDDGKKVELTRFLEPRKLVGNYPYNQPLHRVSTVMQMVPFYVPKAYLMHFTQPLLISKLS
jgi:hypothetical protein